MEVIILSLNEMLSAVAKKIYLMEEAMYAVEF